MKTTLLTLALCVFSMVAYTQELIPFEDENGLYGFKDSTEKVLIEPKYEDANPFSEGLGAVKINDKWGFIDKTGKVIIPLLYDYASVFSEGLASVEMNDKWGCIDKTGKLKIEHKYDLIDEFINGLARVYNNGKWGCVDKNGKLIIPIKYGLLFLNFDSDLILANIGGEMAEYDWSLASGGKWGYLDKLGNEVISFKFDDAELFRNGYAKVYLNNKAGIINQKGEVIIDFKYQYLFYINDSNILIVNEELKNGVCDINETIVLPVVYDDIIPINDSLNAICLNMKWALVDKNFKFLSTHKYDEIFRQNASTAEVIPVNIGGKWGFVNGKGQEIIPFKYENVHYDSEGYYFVEIENKWGVIDRKGKDVTQIKYDYMEYSSGFYKGLAEVKLNDKWGFINKTGKEVIPIIYDGTRSFSEGLAVVKLNDKWGFIDKNGKEIIKCQYEYANSFNEGKAEVTLNGRTFYIDKNGNEIKE